MNLSKELYSENAGSLSKLMPSLSSASKQLGTPFFLVGGVVRDLILGRAILDIDVVVEGDSKSYAETLAEIIGAKTIAKSQFATHKIQIDGLVLDIAMARTEKYSKPGALPKVTSGTIQEDLQRRDFSINAMAVDMNPDDFGFVIDICNGVNDIHAKRLRVLHSKSFQDDATRIIRAVRYEQRLDFKIELGTLKWLKSSVKYLDSISPDRLRREFARMLTEVDPGSSLLRANQLGVLSAISQELKWSTKANSLIAKYGHNFTDHQYYAFLAIRFTEDQGDAFSERLNLPRKTRSIVRNVIELRNSLALEDTPSLTNGKVHQLSSKGTKEGLNAIAILSSDVIIRKRMSSYLKATSRMSNYLTGNDIIELGITIGPEVGLVEFDLQVAQLEGVVKSKKEAVDFVKSCLQ